MDHKTTLPFFSLRSQSSLGCCQIKLCIVTSWVVSTKLSLPSSFKIVSSRMASKTRARAPSISCLLCDGLVAYTRADRQRWPFHCTTHVSGKCHRCYFKCFTICRFDSHMKVEHGASANLSYLLAGCLMSKVGAAYWKWISKNKYSIVQWFQTHLWFQSPNINVLTKEERNVVSAIIEEREESKADAVIVEKVKKLMYFPDKLLKNGQCDPVIVVRWGKIFSR